MDGPTNITAYRVTLLTKKSSVKQDLKEIWCTQNMKFFEPFKFLKGIRETE